MPIASDKNLKLTQLFRFSLRAHLQFIFIPLIFPITLLIEPIVVNQINRILFLGKGLAALTFDKEYQRKRQEQLNKQPANLHEGLARSGKGLVMV